MKYNLPAIGTQKGQCRGCSALTDEMVLDPKNEVTYWMYKCKQCREDE